MTKMTKEQQQQQQQSSSISGWIPIVEDEELQSYAYFLPFHEEDKQIHGLDAAVEVETETDTDTDTDHCCWISHEKLDEWFDALHPSRYSSLDDGEEAAWSDSYHRNIKLLRKTAWVSLDPNCTCEYGYADTWQHQAKNLRFVQTIEDITNAVVSYFQKTRNDEQPQQKQQQIEATSQESGFNVKDNLHVFNAVNLNYYPHGGGVGFHADDEYLFDGLNRPTCILSLSLCSRNTKRHYPMKEEEEIEDKDVRKGSNLTFGARRFVIKRKNPGDTEETVQSFEDETDDDTISTPKKTIEVILKHGDLMTMEGMFQKYFYHAIWPGDSKLFGLDEERTDNDDDGDNDGIDQRADSCHPYTEGERINLTWRLIVQHLDGSKDECRGKTCPLAAEAKQAT